MQQKTWAALLAMCIGLEQVPGAFDTPIPLTKREPYLSFTPKESIRLTAIVLQKECKRRHRLDPHADVRRYGVKLQCDNWGITKCVNTLLKQPITNMEHINYCVVEELKVRKTIEGALQEKAAMKKTKVSSGLQKTLFDSVMYGLMM